MGNTETVTLSEDIKCNGCPVEMKGGGQAIRYHHEEIGGTYHSQGCLEGRMDYYFEGPGLVNLNIPPEDSILQKLREVLRAEFGTI